MTSEFTYTTYIKTTAEKVWQAITSPEFARQYWGMENISDWKKGSEWQHVDPESKQARIIGKVIESNAPTRLVTSWASPNNPTDESHVTYEITAIGDLVRLDVVHANLSPDMGRGVTRGWPLVLSSLKSFLESGKAIDTMDVLKKTGASCKDAA